MSQSLFGLFENKKLYYLFLIREVSMKSRNELPALLMMTYNKKLRDFELLEAIVQIDSFMRMVDEYTKF